MTPVAPRIVNEFSTRIMHASFFLHGRRNTFSEVGGDMLLGAFLYCAL